MIINSFAGIFIPKHLSHILAYEPRLIVLDDCTDFSELLILEKRSTAEGRFVEE